MPTSNRKRGVFLLAHPRLEQRDDIKRVGLLDFQDAVMGPPAYDLVSLLQDARIDVPESIELAMLTRYVKTRRTADPTFDPAAFAQQYAIMSAQRNTRLLGTFVKAPEVQFHHEVYNQFLWNQF